MISMKKYVEKNKKVFPRLGSIEMAAIFDFRALTKVRITLNTASSNAMKGFKHIEDITIKKCTEAF